jgi:catechol-2,3-dioxygenase
LNLDHINIAAPGPLLEQVKAFYCLVFGLEEGFRPSFSSAGYWLYADSSPLIHLSESDKHQRAGHRGHLDHVAFRANGHHAMMQRLADIGVTFHLDHVPELNMTQLFFEDPAGNGLEANFIGESPA